jgi:general secretion pathway protein B
VSYILDALKKSERERTLVRGVGFADAARRAAQGTDWLPWLIAGIVVVTVISVATVFVMRGRLIPAESAIVPSTATSVGPVALAASPTEADESKSGPLVADKPASTGPRSAAQGLAAQALATLPPSIDATVEAAAPLVRAQGETSLLSALPTKFQQSLPTMTVNIHVYSPEESQRILYINNRQYRRGDEIPGGVFVEEIVPDGVVLQFRGQRFKLPRPS